MSVCVNLMESMLLPGCCPQTSVCPLQVIYTFGGVIIIDTSMLCSHRLPCTVFWISDKELANRIVTLLHNANVIGACHACQICQITHNDVCPVQPFLLMGTSYTLKGEPCCFQIGFTRYCMPWALHSEHGKPVLYMAVYCHTHQESLIPIVMERLCSASACSQHDARVPGQVLWLTYMRVT